MHCGSCFESSLPGLVSTQDLLLQDNPEVTLIFHQHGGRFFGWLLSFSRKLLQSTYTNCVDNFVQSECGAPEKAVGFNDVITLEGWV